MQLLEELSLIIIKTQSASPCINQNMNAFFHVYVQISIFLQNSSFISLNKLHPFIIFLKLLSTLIYEASQINLSSYPLELAGPIKQLEKFRSVKRTIVFQHFCDSFLLFSTIFLLFSVTPTIRDSQICFISANCTSKEARRDVIRSQSLLRMVIIQHISLLILKYYYKRISMSIKSSVRAIKNIFQDAVIRIPYFLSSIRSTSTIAILIQTQNITDSISYVESILPRQNGILGYQWKLYYEKDINYKTVIVQFDNISNSEEFYTKYAKNYDKSYGLKPQKDEGINKLFIFFCKDLTNPSINMSDVLYVLGRICVQVPQSPSIRHAIKEVSKFIVVQGIRAEAQLTKCKSKVLPTSSVNLLDFMDPKFLSSESIYYRWRVYSYLQGDGQTGFRLEPFQMTTEGPIYYPPNEQCQKFVYRILSHQERTYITRLLETLSTRKFHIEEAMSFCINNTGSAIEICGIVAVCIVQSCRKLEIEEENKNSRPSEIKHLTALFYLISDIMFNSPLTIYRDIFTVLLPPLISRLPSIPDLTNKISDIIEIWNKKFIMEDQFLRGLKLVVKKQLPSMKPLGMQQMTRVQHQCYMQLVKLETSDEIEELCCKYGLMFTTQKLQECVRDLVATLAVDRRETHDQAEPEPGAFDGQPLTEKDLVKIKSKTCRVVSLDDANLKYLFEKDRNSKSISLQKQ